MNPERKKNLRKPSNARVKGHDLLQTTRVDVTERRKMEEELKNREERYRSLFQNSRDAICITAPDGKFIDFNQAWLDLFGYDREEMLRLGVREIYADPAGREKFLQEMRKKGFVKDYELKVRRKDGAERDCLLTSAPWRASDETVLGYQGILRDMTERKRIEKELAESEQNYRDLTDNAAVGMTTVDLKGRFTYVNGVMADFIGHSVQDLMGHPFKDYIHPEDRGRITRLFFNIILLRRKPKEVELRAMGPDGTVRHLLMRPSRIRVGRKTVGFSAVMIDITERRRMEDELRRSEERFRKIFQSSPIPALITSIEGPILDVNDAWVRMSGYSRDEAIGHSTIELGMTPDPGQRDRILKDLLEKGRLSNVEITRRTKSGELRDLLNTVELVELEGQKCTLNLQVDITERKGMEKELRRHSENLEKLVEERTRDVRESEEKFRRIYNASLDAIYTTSLGGEIVDMNPAGVSMLGFDSLDELKKVNIESRYVNLEDRKRLIELASKGPVRDFEVQFRRKDGERIDAIINCNPLKDEQGRITALQGAIIDITELKQFQKKLHDSEERFRGIAERSFDMIVTLDLEGRVTYASPAVTWVTGYTPEEMVGQHFQNYLPKDVIPKEIEAFVEIAKGGVSRAVQLRIVRKDGSLAQAEVNASPIMSDEKIAGVQAIIRDVTERLAIERMRDRFISTVTHELRTPLVSIKGYVDLALSAEPGQMSKEVESRLQVAKRNTDRLLSLVNDLLDVQRMQAERLQLEIQPTDFNKVVDSCMTEIQPLLEEKKLSLRLEVPEGELRTEGDQTRLCQALMNLLSNAAKFSPEGSEVTLHVEEENESIKVQVSDRGIGIRKEDLKRVFEPFAAIEKPDYVKGTGLGLSITKGLVEAHGGRIWAESEGEGKGATFTFTLPRRKEND